MTRAEAHEVVRQIRQIATLLNQLTDCVQSLAATEEDKKAMRRGVADAMIGLNEHTLLVALRHHPDLDPYRE